MRIMSGWFSSLAGMIKILAVDNYHINSMIHRSTFTCLIDETASRVRTGSCIPTGKASPTNIFQMFQYTDKQCKHTNVLKGIRY
jgi:hypothetical protein